MTDNYSRYVVEHVSIARLEGALFQARCKPFFVGCVWHGSSLDATLRPCLQYILLAEIGFIAQWIATFRECFTAAWCGHVLDHCIFRVTSCFQSLAAHVVIFRHSLLSLTALLCDVSSDAR